MSAGTGVKVGDTAVGAGVEVNVGVGGTGVGIDVGVAAAGTGVAAGVGVGVGVGGTGVGVGAGVAVGGTGVGVATGSGPGTMANKAKVEKPAASPVNSPVHATESPDTTQVVDTVKTLPSSSILVMTISFPSASR